MYIIALNIQQMSSKYFLLKSNTLSAIRTLFFYYYFCLKSKWTAHKWEAPRELRVARSANRRPTEKEKAPELLKLNEPTDKIILSLSMEPTSSAEREASIDPQPPAGPLNPGGPWPLNLLTDAPGEQGERPPNSLWVSPKRKRVEGFRTETPRHAPPIHLCHTQLEEREEMLSFILRFGEWNESLSEAFSFRALTFSGSASFTPLTQSSCWKKLKLNKKWSTNGRQDKRWNVGHLFLLRATRRRAESTEPLTTMMMSFYQTQHSENKPAWAFCAEATTATNQQHWLRLQQVEDELGGWRCFCTPFPLWDFYSNLILKQKLSCWGGVWGMIVL